KLTCAPVIVSPIWNLPFELMCDASDFTVGAVLGQKDALLFTVGAVLGQRLFTRSGKSYNPPVNPNDQRNNYETRINFDSDDEDEEPTPQTKT
ncbi:reverse transcriptase domain-containing protein, partial [Tanacetum coccineum]